MSDFVHLVLPTGAVEASDVVHSFVVSGDVVALPIIKPTMFCKVSEEENGKERGVWYVQSARP